MTAMKMIFGQQSDERPQTPSMATVDWRMKVSLLGGDRLVM
jgi:hypothetical protein